jgi:hypothetical protein
MRDMTEVDVFFFMHKNAAIQQKTGKSFQYLAVVQYMDPGAFGQQCPSEIVHGCRVDHERSQEKQGAIVAGKAHRLPILSVKGIKSFGEVVMATTGADGAIQSVHTSGTRRRKKEPKRSTSENQRRIISPLLKDKQVGLSRHGTHGSNPTVLFDADHITTGGSLQLFKTKALSINSKS